MTDYNLILEGKMKNFNTNIENKEEWLTPPEIIRNLGEFDLDPCAPVIRPWDMAKQHYTVEDDGLSKSWFGRVWCNPPYGRKTFDWLEKLSEHGNGIALIFARTETKGFHAQIWEKANAIFFFEGRLRFFHVDGTQGGAANDPSCLVIYGLLNVAKLQEVVFRGKMRGKIVYLY